MSKEKPSKLDAYEKRLDEWFGIEKQELKWVQEQLRQDGVSVSLSRLSDWWAARQMKLQGERVLSMITSGAREHKVIEEELRSSGGAKFDTVAALHRMWTFQTLKSDGGAETLELGNRMIREMVKIERLRQLDQQNKMEERKLELLEKKAKQADAAAGVVAANLSAEEQAARIREIFRAS